MKYRPSFDPMDENRVALNDRQLVCVSSLTTDLSMIAFITFHTLPVSCKWYDVPYFILREYGNA